MYTKDCLNKIKCLCSLFCIIPRETVGCCVSGRPVFLTDWLPDHRFSLQGVQYADFFSTMPYVLSYLEDC